MSIRTKILNVTLAIILATSVLLTTVWVVSANDMADTYLKDMSDSMMTDAYNAFEYILADTSYMLTQITLNQDNIVEPVENLNRIHLPDNGQLGMDYLQSRRTIRSFIGAMNGHKYYISGIGVVTANGFVFQTSQIVQSHVDMLSLIDEATAEITPTSMTVMAPLPLQQSLSMRPSQFVVPIVKAITNDRQEIIGYTILYFDYAIIEDMFSNNLPYGSRFQVVDGKDNIIYSNCGEHILDTAHPESGHVYNTFHAEKVDWNFIMAIPSGPIRSNVWSALRITGAVTALIVLITIGVCILTVSRITGNIKVLNAEIGEMANGNLTLKKQVHSGDEIDRMEDNFHYMAGRIRDLMKAVAEEEKQKRLTEIAFLQAQINPHFISNTLNLVSWMAKKQHAESIIPLASALNTLLRSAIKKGDDLIPLGEELAMVESYLQIVEYSGSSDFSVEIEIPPETRELYIPRFILQPIVENAIQHGFRDDITRDNRLRIAAVIVDDTLEIQIEDNGVGMSDEKIEAVKHNKVTLAGGFSGVGVGNVQDRIHLFFGEEYGLRYESEPGRYTRVTLALPVCKSRGGEPV